MANDQYVSFNDINPSDLGVINAAKNDLTSSSANSPAISFSDLKATDLIDNSSAYNNIALIPDQNNFLPKMQSFGLGVLKGGSELGQGINQKLLTPAVNKIFGTNLQAPGVNFDNNSSVQQHPNYYGAGEFTGNMAETMPLYAFTGGLAPTLGIGLLADSALGGGIGYLQSQNHPLIETAAGTFGGGVGRALGAGMSSLLKGGVRKTPEQIQATMSAQNEPAMASVPMQAGDVVGSPALSSFYTDLMGKLPLSGVEGSVIDTEKSLNQRASDIANKMLPELDEGVSSVPGEKISNHENLFNTVSESFKKGIGDIKNNAEKMYDESFLKAKNSGININPAEYSSKAQQLLDENNQLSKDFPSLKYNQSTINVLNDAINSGAGSNFPSFENTSKAIQRMNKLSRNNQSDNIDSHVLNQLNGGLRNDFDNAMNLSSELTGNKDPQILNAINSWKNAQQYYKNNVVPYKGLDVDSKGNPLTGQEYVKTLIKRGALSNPALAKKFVDVMPKSANNIPLVKNGEDLRELPGIAYLLSNAPADANTGAITPTAQNIVNAYKALKNPITQKTLFPNSKSSLDNLQSLYDSTAETRNNVLNRPNTGARGLNSGTLGALGLGGGAAYAGYQQGKDLSKGSIPGGIAGGLTGLAGAIAAGHGGARLLENPSFINYVAKNNGITPSVLQAMAKNSPQKLNALLSGLINTYQK
jgi:hypothetical protein